MKAKRMNPAYTASSLSWRGKTRRHPFIRRNRRSIPLRRLYFSRSYSRESFRFFPEGSTGSRPFSLAGARVPSPSQALTITGSAPSVRTSIGRIGSRPSGASPLWPGAREKSTGALSLAAIMRTLVVSPPRDPPIARGPAPVLRRLRPGGHSRRCCPAGESSSRREFPPACGVHRTLPQATRSPSFASSGRGRHPVRRTGRAGVSTCNRSPLHAEGIERMEVGVANIPERFRGRHGNSRELLFRDTTRHHAHGS